MKMESQELLSPHPNPELLEAVLKGIETDLHILLHMQHTYSSNPIVVAHLKNTASSLNFHRHRLQNTPLCDTMQRR